MKHIESAEKVYETDNLNVFKFLLGNRATVEAAIDRLYISMRDAGYIGAPIIVNEHMEIIDGQNRIKAAFKHQRDNGNIVIPYIIRPGYGVNECILLNKNVRNWNTTDYVHSYAAKQEENYVWLEQLHNKYPEFTMDILGGMAVHKGLATNADNATLRGGQLSLTDKDREEVEDAIIFLKDYVESVKNIAGRVFITYNAILYYRSSVHNCDYDKLLNKVFKKNWKRINRSHCMKDYLKQIDEIYNSGIKNPDNRVYAESQYIQEKARSAGK